MPRFDGTGPSGRGPLTGRRRGRCRGSGVKQDEKQDVQNTDTGDTGSGRGRGNYSKGQRRRSGRSEKRRWRN